MNVEKKLDEFCAHVTTIGRNMTELAESESVKSVRARFKSVDQGYSGETLTRVIHAVQIIDQLWSNYLLLASVLKDARATLDKNSVFHNTEQETLDLLEGESVELPRQAIPLEQRGLLSAAEQVSKVAPSELLADMAVKFSEARKIFFEVARTEQEIRERVDGLVQQRSSLAAWATSLGMASPVSQDLEDLLIGLRTDPLACNARIEHLESELLAHRRILQVAEEQRNAVQQKLNSARTNLNELNDLVGRSRSALDEVRDTFLHPEGLLIPASDESLNALATWFDTLENNAKLGRYAAVKIGLEKWLAECQAKLAQEREIYTRNRAGLDERADLAGRFKALRAKSSAYLAQGMQLDATIQTLERDCEAVIALQPFDLKLSRRTLESYETALHALCNAFRKA